MNQNFKSYQALTPGKQVVELRKLANEFGAQPSDVDTFLADLVNSYDCRPGFADAVLKIFEKAWKQADLKGMEMFMNLFRTFTGLEFSDFLNSAYMVATIRAEEHVAEDPQAWACVGKSRAIDQKDGCFSSHWKSGFTAISPCRVDVRTRQVISIVPFDGSCGKDVWWSADYETVKVDGEQHNVRNIDIITDRYAPADVCRELLAMEKAGEYWYSAFGLDFYEELIKAHEAMQIVPESEEPDEARPIPEIVLKDTEGNNRPIQPRDSGDIVTGLFVSHWSSGVQVVVPCDVNLKSREIKNICAWFEPAEYDGDQSICETVTINGQEYPVQNIDDIVTGLEPAEAHESLVRIKENPSPEFWYSLNDRSLEEEIAKAKIDSVTKSEDNSDAEIVEGRFISYWDDGAVIATGCKMNLDTREIVKIETCDDGADHGFCVDESVIIEDEEFPVRNLDRVVEIKDPGELYQRLLNTKKRSMPWYSRSGLNFYEELVKAHIAACPLYLCDGYCDEVTVSVKDSESRFFEYRTDEDEVYSLHRPDDDWGERVSGILADSVRLFAKNQMQLNPGRWTSPANPEN